MPFPHAPLFTSRVPIQFICDQNSSLSITGSSNALFNNPKIFTVSAGAVAKLVQAVDGTSKISGQGEFAPFGLDIEWDTLGYSDYLNLAALTPYMLTFVSFRNVGYYGRLILAGPTSDKPYTSDAVKVKATFLVLGPSDDGGAASISRVPTPTTLSLATAGGGGYILHNTKTYYYLTFKTLWGETDYQVANITTGAGTSNTNTITWSWPNVPWITMGCLYVGSDSNPAHAVLLQEIMVTDSASWTDLVGFAGASPQGVALYQTPPSVNTAYKGRYQGGIWING